MRGRRPDFRLLARGLCVCGALAVAAQGLFAATDLSSVGVGATLAEGVYFLNASRSLVGGVGQAGLAVADGATVAIYLPENVTLTVRGAPASGATAGTPGLRLPSSSTLILVGKGRVEAFGGAAAQGSDAANSVSDEQWDDSRQDGASTEIWHDYDRCKTYGGRGGVGGGGAGAGIGGGGGAGGSRGDCGIIRKNYDANEAGTAGRDGEAGGAGTSGTTMGVLYVLNAVSVEAEGGLEALGGTGGSAASRDFGSWAAWYTFGGSSGGGGAGGGGGAAALMGGGGGGGAGGGGAGGGALNWR